MEIDSDAADTRPYHIAGIYGETAELYFDTIDASMASPWGQTATADLPNFATGEVDIYLFDLKEV